MGKRDAGKGHPLLCPLRFLHLERHKQQKLAACLALIRLKEQKICSQGKVQCRKLPPKPPLLGGITPPHFPLSRLRPEEPLSITHLAARTRRYQQSICPREAVGCSPEATVQCWNYCSPQFLPYGVWYFQPRNKVKTPQELKNRYIPVIFHWQENSN